ncbi:MAG: hypothetical protein EPO40_17595 [Myxococcaceae bacterium]|nr:MAG: hypothetical protein EPO40_17595 [Myxococcaceae bacterium]
MAHTFTIASDENLVQMVASARQRLVFVAPGLRLPVAEAILRAARDRPSLQVVVIVDVDPEVCRFGYGQVEAIEKLVGGLKSVLMQPGLRIGLLISDDVTLVYSPTPLLIEAGSDVMAKPNAVLLGEEGGATIASACGAVPGLPPEIGLKPVTKQRLAEVIADLQANPPKPFDVARQELTFNSELEYVEFEVSDFRLAKKKVALPAEILGVADANLQKRFRNSFQVFAEGTPFEFKVDDPADPGKTITLSETVLKKKADELREDYLPALGEPYRRVILRRRRAEFEREIADFKKRVDAYRKLVLAAIGTEFEKTQRELVEALIDSVAASPPKKWLDKTVSGRLDRAAIKKQLTVMINGSLQDVLGEYNPEVSVVFKGVNYETFARDRLFRARLEQKFGREEIARLFHVQTSVFAADGS